MARRPPPDPAVRDAEIARLDSLATWLDSRFRVPGTGIRFGLDSIAGLIPGVGDAASSAPTAYLIWRARKLGVGRGVVLRMVGNLGLDLAVGTIPVVGDLFDLGFKANRRNVNLLKRHLERQRDRERREQVEGTVRDGGRPATQRPDAGNDVSAPAAHRHRATDSI